MGNRSPEPGDGYLRALSNLWRCAAISGYRVAIETGFKTAWTPSIYTWTQRKGQVVHFAGNPGILEAPPGNLFLLYGTVDDMQRVKHVGFIEYLDAEQGLAQTVEGNTNPRGSSEGWTCQTSSFRPKLTLPTFCVFL